MKPETRARTSTVATASKRPEYSSHWVTRLAIGSETETGMAGGGPPCAHAGVAKRRRPTRAKRRYADTMGTPPRLVGAANAQMWLRCNKLSIGRVFPKGKDSGE